LHSHLRAQESKSTAENLKAKFHDLLSLYKSQEDEELFAALDSSLSPLKRSSPRLLLKFFTHDVKSASEFSEKLRLPEKAVILAKSFFNEIREWLQGERVISCMVVSISWGVGLIARCASDSMALRLRK
jgi:hypothetical protein